MIKLSTLFAVPALMLATTAAIAGDPPKSFTHEGVTYVYRSSTAADGSRVLSGQVLETGSPFRLVVRNGHVRGHADRHPVSFSVSDTRGASQGAVVVERPVRSTSAD